MVTYYLAYTAPINPPNTTPVLTVPQVWQGLQRKIRFAQEFVSAITSCTVLEDKDGVVTREVTFKEGLGLATGVREVVKSYEPTWVDFHQEDGTVIRNLIAAGPDGTDESLHMTYMFEWHYPKIEEGSVEAKETHERLKKMPKMAVDMSINRIREMVVEGKIK